MADAPNAAGTVASTGAARPHVVILGAGFAGLEAAKALAGRPVRVTIVDRQNYHGFQPLYYQVATSGLEPGGVAHAVRDVFHRAPNVDFRLGDVTAIDRAARRVTFADDAPGLAYDALIVAAGAETAYYGVPGAAAHALPLKRLPDATRLRNAVLERFEAYSRDPEHAAPGALTFVIVGGGATGVELAGAFHELFRIALRHDYKAFDTRQARVVLLDQGDALLSGYPERLQAYARRVLERRGVEVRLGEAVARVEPGAVVLKGQDGADGDRIEAETIVWAAGVQGSPVGALLGVERVRGQRVAVTPALHLPGDDRVFVAGDLALVLGAEHVPQQAQPAQQMGVQAARNALAVLAGRPPAPFRYRDLGLDGHHRPQRRRGDVLRQGAPQGPACVDRVGVRPPHAPCRLPQPRARVRRAGCTTTSPTTAAPACSSKRRPPRQSERKSGYPVQDCHCEEVFRRSNLHISEP